MNSSELVDQSGLPVVSGGGEQDAMRSWAQELVFELAVRASR